jgi:hypothetical protein
MLPKLYWRRFRCGACGQIFQLPLDDVTLPRHAPRRGDGDGCRADDAVPL